MDVEHLRHRGWTERELAHARRVAASHPMQTRDHAHLWTLVLLLAVGSIGIGMMLLPLVLFMPLFVSLPVGFLLGLGMGLLFAHSLRSLRAVREHHVRATLVLLCGSLILILLTLHLAQTRFAGAPFARTHSALIIGVPYVLGLVLPYTRERRIHGSP